MEPGDSDLRWVELHFTDLTGILRSVAVPAETYRERRDKGFWKLDGSSVGLAGIEDSDFLILPIHETFNRLPWSPERARVIGKLYRHDGRSRVDPRFIAERADEYVRDQGYEVMLGAELEFFLFNSLEYSIEPLNQYIRIGSEEPPPAGSIAYKQGYELASPINKVWDILVEIGSVLRKGFHIDVTAIHHEVATAGQVELNIPGRGVAEEADNIQTAKYVARNIAAARSYTAVFLPKPFPMDNGSGMHIHISLWRNGANLFSDPDDPAGISQLARYFIGGLIEHGRSLAAFTNPTVNSYRRLVPGYEAPIYLVWGIGNRSTAIRIPRAAHRSPGAARIEYRSPDPSANPYLALAATLLAGLDGIKKKIDPGDPYPGNVYEAAGGARVLPRSLWEAIDELERDNEYLRPVFTQETLELYIETKKKEAMMLAQYPAPAEYYYYINI